MKIKHSKHTAPASDKHAHSAEEEAKPVAEGAGPQAEASAGPAPADGDIPPPDAGGDKEKKAADDRYLRLLADFENFRKRTLREKNDLYRMANEEFILELLPLLDHMDLALQAGRNARADAAVLEGFKIVAEQMAAAMKKFGVEPIEAASRGFDPSEHEAIAHLASGTVPENQVIQQTRRGYRMGTKMLRPAQVVVSSGPAHPSVPSDTGEPVRRDEAPPSGEPGRKED